MRACARKKEKEKLTSRRLFPHRADHTHPIPHPTLPLQARAQADLHPARPARDRLRSDASHAHPERRQADQHLLRGSKHLQRDALAALHDFAFPLGHACEPEAGLAHGRGHGGVWGGRDDARADVVRYYVPVHPEQEPVRVDAWADVGGCALAELFGVVVVGWGGDGGGGGG